MASDLTDENELVHNLMHTAMQQVGHNISHVNANIASYDPRTHRVRCVIPQYVDPNGGESVVTGWLPLMTPSMGNGWGMQYAPFGGATSDNPSAGEQVVIAVLDDIAGSYAVAAYFWNGTNGVVLPTLQAGELIIKDPTGSTVYWKHTGDLEVSASHDVLVNAANNLTATVTAAAAVTAASLTATISGTAAITANTATITANSILLGASEQTLQELMTATALSVFNTHDHPVNGVTTGSSNITSGAPNQQMSSSDLTSTVQAG